MWFFFKGTEKRKTAYKLNKIILFETDKMLIFFLMHSVEYTTCIKIWFFFTGSPYSNNNFLYSWKHFHCDPFFFFSVKSLNATSWSSLYAQCNSLLCSRKATWSSGILRLQLWICNHFRHWRHSQETKRTEAFSGCAYLPTRHSPAIHVSCMYSVQFSHASGLNTDMT